MTAAPASSPPLMGRLRALLRGREILLALAVVILLNAILTSNFATWRNVEITLIQMVFVALVATGITLVIATGGIDLSVGAVMGLASVVAVALMPYGIFAMAAGCLGAGLAVGLFNGALIVGFGVQPLLVTLGSLIWVRGLAQYLSGGRKEYFEDAAMQFLGIGRVWGLPLQVVITAVVVTVVALVVAHTVFGRRLVMVGGNPAAARLAGVPAGRIVVVAYALCGLLAGLAGLFITARVGSSDPTNFGVLIELDAIAAAVVGGTVLAGGRARVVGTAVGALLLQLTTAAMIMNNVGFAVALVVKAALILWVVALQRRRV
jgi:ribose/xylose/arabinose/galactoside ABC-type transport system permease subunit